MQVKSLPFGSNRIERIMTALKDCAAMVILCSDNSIGRPWINFEAGSAWVREISLTPICHSGLRRENLPSPLNLRTAADISNEEDLKNMLSAIANVIGSRVPKIDLKDYLKAIGILEMKYSFGDTVDLYFEELKQLVYINQSRIFGRKLMTNPSNQEKIRKISLALEKIGVCRVEASNMAWSTSNDTISRVTITPLSEYTRPEVQKHLDGVLSKE